MKRYSILLLVFFACACELIVDVDVPFDGEHLVVNSFVCPDSLFSASISLNRFILANDEVPYKSVENATVTVHDETGLVATLQHTADGKYRSQTEKPQVGKQYTLHVSAPNYSEVEAKSMIPNAASITSVDIEETGNENDPKIVVKVKFTDNGQTKDFYHIRIEQLLENVDRNGQVYSFTRPIDVKNDNPDLNTQLISTDAGLLVKDVLFNGEQTEVRVRLQNGQNLSYYAGIRVVLRSVSEDYYNYFATKELQNETSGDPFAQPVNVYNNIANGFGIFAGLSNSIFEYYNPQPVVTEISPSSGKVGDTITITGQNFDDNNSNYFGVSVGFKGQDGRPVWKLSTDGTDTQLKVVVPLGATSGQLLVGRGSSLTLSDIEFQVTN